MIWNQARSKILLTIFMKFTLKYYLMFWLVSHFMLWWSKGDVHKMSFVKRWKWVNFYINNKQDDLLAQIRFFWHDNSVHYMSTLNYLYDSILNKYKRLILESFSGLWVDVLFYFLKDSLDVFFWLPYKVAYFSHRRYLKFIIKLLDNNGKDYFFKTIL